MWPGVSSFYVVLTLETHAINNNKNVYRTIKMFYNSRSGAIPKLLQPLSTILGSNRLNMDVESKGSYYLNNRKRQP